jgi:hypothetical protein
MENSFKSVVSQSRSILILLPTEPLFDQVAAGMGLYLALRQGKDVQIFSPSAMTVEYNRIIGVNKITQELGNKNLIIRFADYKADDIERVSYDIENSQFRLTVIPRQRIAPPSQEQVELSYSGISADTIIMVGGVNENNFPMMGYKEFANANIVHIGTKDLTLSSNKTYLSFSKPASSVSEVTAGLIKESGFNIDEDVATNLLMGIESASDNFAGTNVTAETFLVISDLMSSGGKRISSQPALRREEFPQGAIPGQTFESQTPDQSLTKNQSRMPVVSQQLSQKQESQKPQEEFSEDTEEEAPKDWLQPKIFKGTSVS